MGVCLVVNYLNLANEVFTVAYSLVLLQEVGALEAIKVKILIHVRVQGHGPFHCLES
jgi:hypothetical protein